MPPQCADPSVCSLVKLLLTFVLSPWQRGVTARPPLFVTSGADFREQGDRRRELSRSLSPPPPFHPPLVMVGYACCPNNRPAGNRGAPNGTIFTRGGRARRDSRGGGWWGGNGGSMVVLVANGAWGGATERKRGGGGGVRYV